MKKIPNIDKPLLLLIFLLVALGCMIFASAAFGLLARGETDISSVVFNHIVLGVGVGLIALVLGASIDYRKWRLLAPYLYGLSVFATALVFVPHVGLNLLGGRRWIEIAHVSFQPSEALKVGCILMASAYFTAMRGKIGSWLYGLGGLAGILALPVILLVLQPDIGTLGVICITVVAIFWVAGGRLSHLVVVGLVAAIALGGLVAFKPYIRDRVMTFLNPSQGQQSESYQIKQSLIAIGSGEFMGRGWGQGIQKFTYLPEPMGDSIFAVAGEELGFIGSSALIILYLLFALRGCQVAARASEMFGTLVAVGISTYLGIEAFINIAAMLGVTPLTGIPLTFVSQGGTAMLVSLASAGVLLNISKSRKKSGVGN